MKLKELAGEDWFNLLINFFKSPYFKTIQKRLQEELQKDNTSLTPSLDEMFSCFKLCPYKKLKVVILNDMPMQVAGANDGLAFSFSKENIQLPKEAEAFNEGIEEEIYGGFNLKRNYNLKRLAEQGVLLLNSSLSMVLSEGNWEDHRDLWRPFISYALTKIAKNNTGIVFVLCGKNVRNFSNIILPTANFLLSCPHPRDAKHFAMTWDSGGVFDLTNRILKQTINDQIIW